MAKKAHQPNATFLQRFWLPIILAIITLLGTIVSILGPKLLDLISGTFTTSVSKTFDYQVHVQTTTGDPIENATVSIDIGGGKAPLDTISDAVGLARIFIDESYAGKPSRLVIRKTGYKIFMQNIDLTEGSLPKIVQLEPIP